MASSVRVIRTTFTEQRVLAVVLDTGNGRRVCIGREASGKLGACLAEGGALGAASLVEPEDLATFVDALGALLDGE